MSPPPIFSLLSLPLPEVPIKVSDFLIYNWNLFVAMNTADEL